VTLLEAGAAKSAGAGVSFWNYLLYLSEVFIIGWYYF